MASRVVAGCEELLVLLLPVPDKLSAGCNGYEEPHKIVMGKSKLQMVEQYFLKFALSALVSQCICGWLVAWQTCCYKYACILYEKCWVMLLDVLHGCWRLINRNEYPKRKEN